jgi:hypothetical protein
MLFEDLFWLIVSAFVARAVWRLVSGVMERPASDRQTRGSSPTADSVHMERDPVCGTYVVPERAVRLADGAHDIYFCSTACRDKYRARTA